MKKTFTLLSMFAAFAQAGTLQAQDLGCGTTQRLKTLYEKNPQLRQDHEDFLRSCFSGAARSDSNQVYVIPVVFHVMHEYGSENISDAQVRDALRVLNEDFRKQNADTILIVPGFQALAADAHIEFRLASLDPEGNCTNGINHYYTHETRVGDDFSKTVQWPRSRYLNFWVTKNIDEPGVAAYAYHPTDVASLPMAVVDGIIVYNSYVGSIGTASPSIRHTLTHEVGHYLSLPHTWGNTNAAGVTCGDDGIADTPVTKGHTSCTAADLNDMSCTPGVQENTQNFMEYSFCQFMYTFDQKGVMRTTLESSVADRNNLWSASNLTATGVDVVPAPVCTPMPDMHPARKYVCLGQSVQFFDDSWRAGVDSWSWSFPGGIPATSTAENPVITFNTPGWHDVTLTVTNTAGTETKTFTQSVMVSNPWPDYTAPFAEGFEALAPSEIWVYDNPESNEALWHRTNATAATGSYSFVLNNHKDIDIFSANYFNNLGGNIDALISPAFDLSHISSATLTFKYAAASHAVNPVDQTEKLQVYSSINCGETWQPRGAAITGNELSTGGTALGNYIPSAGHWVTKTITLPVSVLQDNVRFKFEYTASDYSNNIYIDDININGVVGLPDMHAEGFAMSVYPNPAGTAQGVTLSLEGYNESLELLVCDIVGKVVYRAPLNPQNGKVEYHIPGNLLRSGLYTATVTNGTASRTMKFVMQ